MVAAAALASSVACVYVFHTRITWHSRQNRYAGNVVFLLSPFIFMFIVCVRFFALFKTDDTTNCCEIKPYTNNCRRGTRSRWTHWVDVNNCVHVPVDKTNISANWNEFNWGLRHLNEATLRRSESIKMSWTADRSCETTYFAVRRVSLFRLCIGKIWEKYP